MQYTWVGIWECHVCTLHQHADVCVLPELLKKAESWPRDVTAFNIWMDLGCAWAAETLGCLPAPSAKFTHWDVTQVHISLVPTPATLRFSLPVQAEHKAELSGNKDNQAHCAIHKVLITARGLRNK